MKAQQVTVAVVQAAPTLFDRQSAMDKIASMAKEAAEQGAKLVVFPEVFCLDIRGG